MALGPGSIAITGFNADGTDDLPAAPVLGRRDQQVVPFLRPLGPALQALAPARSGVTVTQ